MPGTVTLDDLSEPVDPMVFADWNADGVEVLWDAIDDELIEAYKTVWADANGYRGLVGVDEELWTLDAARPGGWSDCTPYMRHEALRRLVCDPLLASTLEHLIGEPAGVHLNLTGWVTTERNWHQDTYLNPSVVGDRYAAVWIALGDIHPDSGPFEYIPGSHRWHRLLRDRIFATGIVDPTDPTWPKQTEDALTPLVEAEIERRYAEVIRWLPERGDVLIWHSRLYHRGSKANIPGAYRPALIAHYSGIYHRPDMPKAVQHEAGGWYFPITGFQPT